MYLSTDKVYCHNRFLKYHKCLLTQLTKKGNNNLYLPRELGGLGFDLYPNIPFKITAFQTQLANFMAKKLDNMEGMYSNQLTERTVRLVQTNAPIVTQTYVGDCKYVCIPNTAPLPNGFEELTTSPSLLFSTDPNEMNPILSYKYIKTSFLKEFRLNKPLSNKRRFNKYLGEYNRFSHRVITSQSRDRISIHNRLRNLLSLHGGTYCVPCGLLDKIVLEDFRVLNSDKTDLGTSSQTAL
jgi:hypothetical protein